MFYFIFGYLVYGSIYVIMHWHFAQVKNSNITCFYVEIVYPGCIDFVSFED
jgi:hypothetical protein